jgi:uncharacterized protein with HEPN domain
MSKLLDSTRIQQLEYTATRIVVRLTAGTLADFLANEDLQDVALHQFMVMGEAAARVSDDTKQQYPQIEWRRITGLRNFIAHEYFKVDYVSIWDTAVNTLPPLLAALPIVLQQVIADEHGKSDASV